MDPFLTIIELEFQKTDIDECLFASDNAGIKSIISN